VIRVVVVDDHPIFRLGLAATLGDLDDVELVGEAASAADVPELMLHVSPDVVLLDLHLSDGSGLDVNRWLAREHAGTKVIVLTMSEDHHAAVSAIRDGACGYLVKGADPSRLEHAIRAVMAGEVVLDHDIAGIITGLTQLRSSQPSEFPQLSPREFDILTLLARGLDNSTIARELLLSPKTVRNHVSNIFAKINVTDRAQAIVLAHQHGVGTLDS
jgi:DNA-binding NarL/FixJ family response regulator